jgi:hypothetical protein
MLSEVVVLLTILLSVIHKTLQVSVMNLSSARVLTHFQPALGVLQAIPLLCFPVELHIAAFYYHNTPGFQISGSVLVIPSV